MYIKWCYYRKISAIAIDVIVSNSNFVSKFILLGM